MYGEGDFDAVAELYSEAAEFVLADGSVVRGRENVVGFLKDEAEAFSDASFTWEILAVNGPTVVQAWTWSAKHTGDLTLP
ncbi:MAG: SnoaL-like polyketide cyclase, partial [Rubrobacteraceae bacterium]|nr:SnoaL-like polyketide cyclase [Rubrobacteraceae bacterium]